MQCLKVGCFAMSINKFNAEGYYDPTCYEALSKVEREEKQAAYQPLVYVCSPFSGDVEYNTEQARKYSRFAFENQTIPIAPHLLFPQFLDDTNPKEREAAMHFDYVLLGKCKEIWVFGGIITKGMEQEIRVAKKRRQKIRWFNASLEEVEEYGV